MFASRTDFANGLSFVRRSNACVIPSTCCAGSFVQPRGRRRCFKWLSQTVACRSYRGLPENLFRQTALSRLVTPVHSSIRYGQRNIDGARERQDRRRSDRRRPGFVFNIGRSVSDKALRDFRPTVSHLVRFAARGLYAICCRIDRGSAYPQQRLTAASGEGDSRLLTFRLTVQWSVSKIAVVLRNGLLYG